MSKIEALKIVDEKIIETVNRIHNNKMNIRMIDLFYLRDRYSEISTDNYTDRMLSGCSDCRQYIYKFWYNVVDKWIKEN